MNGYFLLSIAGLYLLISLLGATVGQAQPVQFERIGLEQGLSQTDVHYIIQDHKGYMWFATTDGLNKYDGYTFRSYKYDPNDPKSLGQSTCLTLYEDKQGMIWVGLVGEGMCRFDPTTEKFTRYPPKRTGQFALHDGVVVAFNEDDDGMLWVGTGRISELKRLDKKTGRFYETGYNPPGHTSTGDIHTIYRDKSGTFWIGSESGLHRAEFTSTTSKQSAQINFTYDPLAKINPGITDIGDGNSIFEDHAGVLWFGTYTNGLLSYDRKSNTIHQYRHDPNNANSISENYIQRSAIAEDQQGNLWIGTNATGLNKLNRERTQFTHYTNDLGNSSSLSSNSLLALMVDRSNILWIGTVGGGISKFDPNKRTFPVYRHHLQQANSLTPFGVRSICEDKAGVVWVGTEGGGLDKLDKTTGKFTHFRHQPNNPTSLYNNYVPAILEDKEYNLWIGTEKGLSKLNRQTGVFERYFTDTGRDRSEDYTYTLFQDQAGLIWIGTTNGVKSFNPKTGAVVVYPCDPNDPESLSDYWAYAITEDRQHNIWVGTYDGLNYLNRKTGKFTHYNHRDGDAVSIGSNTIRSLYTDAGGTLWVGTLGGGLNWFDERANSFQTFTEKDGLANNSVYAIQPDQAGNLWLATNKGLTRFSPATRTFANFDVSDGLQSDQFASGYLNAGASFKGKDGLLYFGGINGFNVFDPKKIQLNRHIAAVVITQFKLFDRRVPGKAESSEIELRYNENFFTFEFAALNYTNTQKNQYAYKLEGVDPDWIYSGFRHSASYTDIGPGTYVFRVKGTNNDGRWNEKGTLVRLIIHPPWWRTWWAYLLYTLAAIAGIWAFIQYRSRALRKENRLLEEKVSLRTNELERKSNELAQSLDHLRTTQTQLIQSEKMASLGELTAGIAHEIQNPLNFVNNFSEVSTELVDELVEEQQKPDRDSELETELLGDLKQNLQKITQHGHRASAIVKGMLEHSRTSTGERQPTDLNALCEEYLRLAYQGVRAKDKLFTCALVTDFEPKLERLDLVPQELGRVLLNLFNNAFYALQEKAHQTGNDYRPTVSVTTAHVNGQVEIRVRDNGTGIPESVKAKIFQPFFTTKPTGQGTGLGLSLSYDIVTKGHGGELIVQSQVGGGTEFRVILPISAS